MVFCLFFFFSGSECAAPLNGACMKVKVVQVGRSLARHYVQEWQIVMSSAQTEEGPDLRPHCPR